MGSSLDCCQEKNKKEIRLNAINNQSGNLNLKYPKINNDIESIINVFIIKSGKPVKNIKIFLGINIGSYKTVYSLFQEEDKKYVYKVILMNGNSRIIPTKICYSNHRLIGDNAKNFIKLNLNTSYNNLSRIIGYERSDFYKEEFKYMYNSKENINNIIKIGSECIIADFIYLINEYYFDKLKIKYDSCCLSVPDFYTPLQRQKLKLICEAIGMKNIKIFDESLAITMYYGYTKYNEIFIGKQKEDIVKNVLFIDIGHSKTSFILSIFKYNEFKVEKVLSNPNLGGRNIELLIYDYCIKKFGINKSDISDKMKFRLIEEINKKIKNFSISDEIEIKVDSFYEDDDMEIIITEKEFINIIKDDFIKKIEELCDGINNYLETNGITIDSVECAGELIRIKLFQDIFLNKGFSIPDEINENGVSRTLLIDECASVGAALLDNFICGKCPIKNTLKSIIYNEKEEFNKNYSDNDLVQRIKIFIDDNDSNEKLYDNFTEMKNEYKKYIYNLQKINSVNDDIKQQLEDLQFELQNFEFKTIDDKKKMEKKYEEIKTVAKTIIDYLINEIQNKPENVKNNNLVGDLLDIKEKLSSKSEDKEKIYKRLEDLYLKNW